MLRRNIDLPQAIQSERTSMEIILFIIGTPLLLAVLAFERKA